MYAISDRFRAALIDSQQVITRADLYRSGAIVEADLPITGGQVTVDKAASARRQCSVTLVDEYGLLTPRGGLDNLAPYGNELRLYRGLRLPVTPAGLPELDELLPLGVFRLSTSGWADEGTREITVSGYDRSRPVSRAKFENPYIVAAGTNVAVAVATLLENRFPEVEFSSEWVTTAETTPLLVFDTSDDPWDQATKMAQSIGCELFFDADGKATLRVEPDPTTADPVWSYVDGASATILSAGKTFDDEPGYNGVILSGETASGAAPVRATVWDTDPASPTYYLGPYGKVPLFETSPFVATLTAATAAATASLQRNIGGTERITLSAIPNPAHEAGDIIYVQRSDVLADVCVMQSATIPLAVSEAMTIASQQRRSAA